MSTATLPAACAPVAYRVTPHDLHAHLFAVELVVSRPAAQMTFSMPVWIAGSYLVREFARQIQCLSARQPGRAVALTPLDKCTWQADGVNPAHPLVLHYTVYAFDASVRAAWLDSQRGFFNGTSLLLRVHGLADGPHDLHVLAPAEAGVADRWQLATGLTAIQTDARGFGHYRAADYDQLVDAPVEMGAFWHGHFMAAGVPHRLVVAGAPPAFDGARLLADTRRICEAAIALWHPRGQPPHERYVFLLNAVREGYGGLEHHNSTALLCRRADLPRTGQPQASPGYVTLLGLISHEYFHTWNVKRLRPAEWTRYDYSRENHSRLLWFFEGFTSYYDDLLLHRAGLIDSAAYLALLAKTINQLRQTPGRKVQSVAQASFDAWIKHYRPDENTANATVSYYTKGALVALCLDLSLRNQSHGSLDDVMRGLWQRCKGGPMTEDDLLAVLREVGGRSYARELAAWVHGTAELPLQALLQAHGVVVQTEPPTVAQRLGLRVTEAGGRITIAAVLRGSVAEQAGFAAGDEWLGIEAGARGQGGAWRLHQLDELPLFAGPHRHLTALIARDQRLLKLPLRQLFASDAAIKNKAPWRLSWAPGYPATLG